MTQVLLALMPSFFSFLAMEKPGVFFSTTKALMPLYPLSGSWLAKTRKNPASMLLVIHILEPEIR